MELLDWVGIEVVEATGTSVILRWVVTDRLTQPDGILHGGISAAVAETAASMGARAALGEDDERSPLGLELSSTHLQGVQVGDKVETRAHPLRQGKRIQIWSIEQYICPGDILFNVSKLDVYCKKVL